MSEESRDDLRNSEQMFRRMAENAKDVIYRMSLPDGNYEYINPAATELFGYSPQEWYDNSKLIGEVIHPDWHDYFKREWHNLLAGNMPPFYEYQIVHKSGAVRWMNQRNVLITGEDGKPVAIEGIVTDVTESKQIEEALKKSERSYRTLVENLAQKIFLKDLDSTYISCNSAYAEYLGVQAHDIAGKTDYDFYPKEAAEKYRADDRRIMDSGLSDEIIETYDLEGMDGWAQTVKVPVRDDNGNVTGILGIFWDITDRKKAEDDLRNSLKERELLIKEVHHRVRNNLQVIVSMLHLQLEKIKDHTSRDMFQHTTNRIYSMALVHEKLYHSPDFSRIPFKEYIRSMTAWLMCEYPYAAGVEIDLRMEDIDIGIDLAIPCGLIINELVTNAIQHAFQASCEGKCICLEFHPPVNGFYQLTVRDNGVGLPKELDMEDEKSIKTLGLQLVRGLIRQLDGTLAVDRNEGTRFIIRFPVRDQETLLAV